MPKGVSIFVGIVALLAAGVTFVDAGTAPAIGSSWPLLVFFALVVAAEWLDVRFRFHGQIEAFNLSEAVLAPLLFAFTGPAAIAVVATSHLAVGIVRRNQPVKAIFNVAQWALAAGVASYVLLKLQHGDHVTGHNMLALLIAMVAIGLVNQVALTVVIGLAQRRNVVEVIESLSSIIVPGWLVAWGMNTLIGGLFVLAYGSSPFASLLFFVPLGVLHAAYRGYAGMVSDRMRLAGLHRASGVLAGASSQGDRAMAEFLAEVCRCFEANAAELMLVQDEGIVVHRIVNSNADTFAKIVARNDDDLRSAMVNMSTTARIRAGSDARVSVALEEAGWTDCLMTPFSGENVVPGVLAVYNQNGLEGFEEGERAVLEALARETASSFEKGRLFAAIAQERHKLSAIVESTSDGVLSLTPEGIVRTWNPGWEEITGKRASAAIGRRSADVMTLSDADGRSITFDSWADRNGRLPEEVQLVDTNGGIHWLECSYKTEVDDNGFVDALVIVARDVSDERQIEQLREDMDRLAEREALQRQRVLELQESLQPAIPVVDETEFGVHYLPSDTSAPTGGDFYDWQTLPGGDIHVSVVDVLGSGVEATNDAIAVTHTLRLLAYQGVPVEQLVRGADELLAAANPELVATVICLRYNPGTGRARLAGGGHPPPLLVHGDGTVSEIAAPGIPVGWPGAGSDHYVDVTLEPSDSLVLYTDGLVEARRDILAGLESLGRIASQTRSQPVDAVARMLVEQSLEGADRRDDSLALVVRRSAAQVNVDRFSRRGRNAADEVRLARHQFQAWLAEREEVSQSSDDLCVIVSELVTNAVRAGETFFELRAWTQGDEVVIEVEDDGPGFDGEFLLEDQPDFDEESGRGLFIVRMLVDEVTVSSSSHGSVVRAVKKVPESDVDQPEIGLVVENSPAAKAV
jgi:PAS domain S-box-containing protein